MPARRPVALSRFRGQRMGDHGPINDFGQQTAPVREPEGLDDRAVVAAIAKIAKSEARLGRVGRAISGELKVQPVLAMQSCLRPVKQLHLNGDPCARAGFLAGRC